MSAPQNVKGDSTRPPLKFSYFEKCTAKQPQGSTYLANLYQAIVKGRWKKPVETCRDLLRTKGEPAYNEYRKNHIPAVMLSATVNDRSSGLTAAQRAATFSGLLQLDFDDVGPELEAFRRILTEAPFIAAVWVSLSGSGLKAVARIPASEEAHAGAWQAAKEYFAVRGLVLDKVVKSLWNLCFISYDPLAHFNPDATELQPVEQPTDDGVQSSGDDPEEEEATEETEAIQARLAAKNSLLPRLLKGEWEGKFQSQSEADFSLSCSICEATGNQLQQEEIFEQSGLYRDRRKMRLALKAARKLVAQKRAGIAAMPDLEEAGITGDENPFPVDCLPPVPAAMAREIARVSTSQNVPLAVASVMGIISGSLGAGLELSSTGGRTLRGNLFILAIAPSGSGKSESLKPAEKPFTDAEAEAIELWTSSEKPKLTAELTLLKKREDRILKKAAGVNDTNELSGELMDVEVRKNAIIRLLAACPRYHVGDGTKESLQSKISTQPGEALASMSAEARGILNVVRGRYGNGSGGDEDFYLAAYSGDSVKVDRVGRGEVALKRPCLTILWMVQPDAAGGAVSDPSMMVSGMIPRFLLFDSHAEAQTRHTPPNPFSDEIAKEWDSLIRFLLETYRAHGGTPRLVEPEDDAAALLYEYEQETILLRGSSGSLRDVRALVSRWAENAYRIALVLHAGRWGAQSHSIRLSEIDARNAIEIMRWFADRQLAVLAGVRRENLRQRLSALLTVLADRGGKSTMRDLSRTHSFKEDEVRRIQSAFPKAIVIEKKEDTGGRPSIIVRRL